jgi:hypothetical protein
MASIRFDKVQKRFSDTLVVHDLDLLIEDEEFFTQRLRQIDCAQSDRRPRADQCRRALLR